MSLWRKIQNCTQNLPIQLTCSFQAISIYPPKAAYLNQRGQVTQSTKSINNETKNSWGSGGGGGDIICCQPIPGFKAHFKVVIKIRVQSLETCDQNSWTCHKLYLLLGFAILCNDTSGAICDNHLKLTITMGTCCECRACRGTCPLSCVVDATT